MVSFRFTIARALLTAMAAPVSSEQPPRIVGDVTVSHPGRAERLRGACLTGTSLAGRWSSRPVRKLRRSQNTRFKQSGEGSRLRKLGPMAATTSNP